MSHVRVAKLRIFAWLIDWLVVSGLGVLFAGFGWPLMFAYWLIRDGLFEGQSVGKRVMRLAVVTEDGRPCTILRSIVRNALWVIPVVNFVLAITGLHYLFHSPSGQHWGDRLAETFVVRKAQKIEIVDI